MEIVRFIIKFEDFSNEDVFYMYYCYLLIYEDDGMMGQFFVVDNIIGIVELNENVVWVYFNFVIDIFIV